MMELMNTLRSLYPKVSPRKNETTATARIRKGLEDGLLTQNEAAELMLVLGS